MIPAHADARRAFEKKTDIQKAKQIVDVMNSSKKTKRMRGLTVVMIFPPTKIKTSKMTWKNQVLNTKKKKKKKDSYRDGQLQPGGDEPGDPVGRVGHPHHLHGFLKARLFLVHDAATSNICIIFIEGVLFYICCSCSLALLL
jgi:hypothetical protein